MSTVVGRGQVSTSSMAGEALPWQRTQRTISVSSIFEDDQRAGYENLQPEDSELDARGAWCSTYIGTKRTRFRTQRLEEGWGSLIGVTNPVALGARFFAEGQEQRNVTACSYPNCCVVPAHSLGPDLHECSLEGCTNVLHFICQGHYDLAQEMPVLERSGNHQIAREWVPLCYEHDVQKVDELRRKEARRNARTSATSLFSTSGLFEDDVKKKPVEREATLFRQLMRNASPAAHVQQKGTELGQSIKKAKVRKSRQVLGILENFWEVICCGDKSKPSCTQHEYMQMNDNLLHVMCEDVDLSDEKIKRQLLNGFWVESSGSQELEKSKCLDIVASVAVNFVKKLSETALAQFLEQMFVSATERLPDGSCVWLRRLEGPPGSTLNLNNNLKKETSVADLFLSMVDPLQDAAAQEELDAKSDQSTSEEQNSAASTPSHASREEEEVVSVPSQEERVRFVEDDQEDSTLFEIQHMICQGAITIEDAPAMLESVGVDPNSPAGKLKMHLLKTKSVRAPPSMRPLLPMEQDLENPLSELSLSMENLMKMEERGSGHLIQTLDKDTGEPVFSLQRGAPRSNHAENAVVVSSSSILQNQLRQQMALQELHEITTASSIGPRDSLCRSAAFPPRSLMSLPVSNTRAFPPSRGENFAARGRRGMRTRTHAVFADPAARPTSAEHLSRLGGASFPASDAHARGSQRPGFAASTTSRFAPFQPQPYDGDSLNYSMDSINGYGNSPAQARGGFGGLSRDRFGRGGAFAASNLWGDADYAPIMEEAVKWDPSMYKPFVPVKMERDPIQFQVPSCYERWERRRLEREERDGMMQAKYYSRSWTAPFRMDSALASRGFKHALLVSTPKVAEQTMRKLVHLPRSKVDWVVARSEDSWKFQTSAMPLKAGPMRFKVDELSKLPRGKLKELSFEQEYKKLNKALYKEPKEPELPKLASPQRAPEETIPSTKAQEDKAFPIIHAKSEPLHAFSTMHPSRPTRRVAAGDVTTAADSNLPRFFSPSRPRPKVHYKIASEGPCQDLESFSTEVSPWLNPQPTNHIDLELDMLPKRPMNETPPRQWRSKAAPSDKANGYMPSGTEIRIPVSQLGKLQFT